MRTLFRKWWATKTNDRPPAPAMTAVAPKKRVALPLKGYAEASHPTKYVDILSDDDLAELNGLLNWRCFTVDGQGRRFGDSAWEGKRSEPQDIPDRKIVLMNERFDLSDKHVLEVGCFEGVHTVGLSRYARRVTAVDSRVDNVVKTIIRCAFFGYCPTVFKCNVEERPLPVEALSADIMHHVGVLYHLKDPVSHLLGLGQYVRRGLMLDTHYSLEHEATEAYEVEGKEYRYKTYQEFGHADPFSGMYDHSKWLRLEDIAALLSEAGFGQIEIVETRNERNGARVLLIARRG